MKDKAGKPYRPNNGTEGMVFMHDFCDQCKHGVPSFGKDECDIRFRAFWTEIAEDKTVTVQGTVWDEASAIVGIEYRVGEEGKWRSVAAEDGLFDARGERFRMQTTALDAGEKVVTVRVRDAAGNKADTDITVDIPADEEKEEPGEEEGAEEGKKPEEEEAEKGEE